MLFFVNLIGDHLRKLQVVEHSLAEN